MSFHLNPVNNDADYIERTERIYIDPEQLIALKTKRKTFSMVPSIYQPPEEQFSFKDHASWNKTTEHSLMKNKTLSYTDKRFSRNFYEQQQETFPQQKIKRLQDILEGQNIAPNVQFIWKLLPSSYKKQIINFQQGDCVPLKGQNDDKYLILSGEVRLIGVNDHQFKRKAGFMFFISNQTQSKIKQIVVLRSTRLLKIPNNNIYQSLIRNYLHLKNSQKIKFIQYCPFFIWKNQLTQDLASCMEMKLTEKEEIIYQANSTPDCIYFVKQGIVLLERNSKLINPVIEDYEQHYQKNQISQKDTILVVRKGMAFGIDGIIIKEFTTSAFDNLQLQQAMIQKLAPEQMMQSYSKQLQKSQHQDSQNPQTSIPLKNVPRKNMRIYTAKTLGKCELYCLDKRILQTLFSISDINQEIFIKKKQILPEELERMSIEYTNMLSNNTNAILPQVALKKKQLVLKIQNRPFPKSKSVALLQNRHNSSSIVSEGLNNSPKAFLFKIKKQSFQQTINTNKIIKSQFYLNEEKQKNQLRNRIKSERQKSKFMKIKKANSNENLIPKKDDKDLYILPKLANNSKTKIDLDKVNRKQKINEKNKLEEIIKMKLKQSIKSYSKTPQVQKHQAININQQNTKQSQLSKLLQQNQNSRGNPSFINIKSYKSIISVYESTNNH